MCRLYPNFFFTAATFTVLAQLGRCKVNARPAFSEAFWAFFSVAKAFLSIIFLSVDLLRPTPLACGEACDVLDPQSPTAAASWPSGQASNKRGCSEDFSRPHSMRPGTHLIATRGSGVALYSDGATSAKAEKTPWLDVAVRRRVNALPLDCPNRHRGYSQTRP